MSRRRPSHARYVAVALPLLAVVALAMLVGLAANSPAIAGPAQARSADTCTNPDCHPGGPDGTATSTPVPVSLSKPTVKARPKGTGRITVAGTLSASHDTTTTLTLEFSRKVGGKYRVRRTAVVTLVPGATGYSLKLRLTAKGHWKVRALHTCDVHSASASGFRAFVVKRR